MEAASNYITNPNILNTTSDIIFKTKITLKKITIDGNINIDGYTMTSKLLLSLFN